MKTGYWRSIASVLSGTAMAQVVPVLGSLVLARQYAPAEFGIFSAWLGVVLLLSVLLTGRFETALAIEDDGEPRRRAVICTLWTVVFAGLLVSGILAGAVLAKVGWLADKTPSLISTLVPTAILIAAAQTWQSWAAAEGMYRQLSSMRITQAGAVTLLQIGAGTIFASAGALAIAHLLGVLIGLIIAVWMMPLGALPEGRFATAIGQFWYRHRRFPIFSLPADGVNTAAAHLPVLIVASRFGVEIAGLLALTMRTLGTPIALLGKSVLDVFKRHAASAFRERGECRAEYLRTFNTLLLASTVFCLVLAICSEHLFAVAFGEKWRDAGSIAVWLLPLFALRFIASPLSYLVYIAEKQHLDLVWQVVLLAMTLATLNIPTRYDIALQSYSVGYAALYVVYLGMSYRFSLGKAA